MPPWTIGGRPPSPRPFSKGCSDGNWVFDGLILTDCLEMAAIAARYAPEEYAVAAVEAGADLLLISHTYERQLAARDALAGGHPPGQPAQGTSPRLGPSGAGRQRTSGSIPGGRARRRGLEKMRPRHARLEAAVAERAVTLVKNDGLIPLRRDGEGSWWFGRCTHRGRGSGIPPPLARWARRSVGTIRRRRSTACRSSPGRRTSGRCRAGGRERRHHRRHHHRPAGTERGAD